MPEPRRLPGRPVSNGLPAEPVVLTDPLTYCCGRCGAVVGNAELHALWHVTIGYALDDVEALVVQHEPETETGTLDGNPAFAEPVDEGGHRHAAPMTDPSTRSPHEP